MMVDMIHNVANYLHILAAVSLLMKIWCTQNCAGISGKTQLLYAIVYASRYLDLFYIYVSMENTVLKIFYNVLGSLTVVSIYFFFNKTHEHKYDTFRIELLIITCAIFAIFLNHEFDAIEVLWTFSIYLEGVAILPQFYFISKAKRLHKHVFYYILALGIYKGLYIAHWLYRYYTEGHYDKIAAASGLVQFIIYCDFFARVLPYVKCIDDNDEQMQRCDDVASVEKAYNNAASDTGYISAIVLTPASLLTHGSDKIALLKDENEELEKC